MSHWEESSASDEWYTPKYIFDALGCVFDVDVAAPEDRTHCHVPAKRFITEISLVVPWDGFAWMNPPFGTRNSIKRWLDRMAVHANGIALTSDRTSAPWWQDAAKRADAVLFVSGKIRFIRQDGSLRGSPSNGTTLFAYGDLAVKALTNARENKLGVMFSPLK